MANWKRKSTYWGSNILKEDILLKECWEDFLFLQIIEMGSMAECNEERKKLLCSRKGDSKTFRDFYYLKEELADFCRENGLPVSGGKLEISDRIVYFFDTGKAMPAKAVKRITAKISDITEDTKNNYKGIIAMKEQTL